MIVVADTSPINYLIQIRHIEILEVLYEKVLIPSEVLRELRSDFAPGDVRAWAERPPKWVNVRTAKSNPTVGLYKLDAGEKEAISLALETEADVLIVDERKARQVAESTFGLQVVGTLGILRDAHRQGHLDGFGAFASLCNQTTFRATPRVKQTFLATLRE